MAITITNLRVDARDNSVPFLVVNCVFKCARSSDLHEDFAWQQARAESKEYRQFLTIDDPERYEDWISNHWDFHTKYDGYGRAWTPNECPWHYIEKFDVFWFREWISDCSVTRAILAELQYYKEHGKLPTVYRSVEDGIILSHLRALQSYWD